MSIINIKQELKLLNQQLADLEINIHDPIERNESKQQLNKQIKKLERKLQNLEQIELEKQELQAIQSQLTLDNKLSKKQSAILDSDPERKNIKSQTDTINLNKSLTNSEHYININPTHDLSSQQDIAKKSIITSSSSTPNYPRNNTLKDWQKTVISSSIICIFIFLGLIFIKYNYSLQSTKSQLTTSTSTEEQAQSSLSEITKSPDSISSSENTKEDDFSETLITKQRSIESFSGVTNQSQKQYSDNISNTKSENIAYNYNFPLNSCGDKDPGGTNTWYAVYIDSTLENLNLIRNSYCRDAFSKYRQDREIKSIQVASFLDLKEAENFARLMQQQVGSGEVGEPVVYDFGNVSTGIPTNNYSINNNTNYRRNLKDNSAKNSISIDSTKKQIDDLADRTFYSRHPELRGRKIRTNETFLRQEWLKIRDCEATVDYLFYQRYPELRGRKILAKEKHLVREWLQIKKNTIGCN